MPEGQWLSEVDEFNLSSAPTSHVTLGQVTSLIITAVSAGSMGYSMNRSELEFCIFHLQIQCSEHDVLLLLLFCIYVCFKSSSPLNFLKCKMGMMIVPTYRIVCGSNNSKQLLHIYCAPAVFCLWCFFKSLKQTGIIISPILQIKEQRGLERKVAFSKPRGGYWVVVWDSEWSLQKGPGPEKASVAASSSLEGRVWYWWTWKSLDFHNPQSSSPT